MWIKTTEQLPEVSNNGLLVYPSYDIAWFLNISGSTDFYWLDHKGDYHGLTVTHWMYLPKPPKE